jgi:Type IV secretion-system coupling protein DNA-binding domain
MPSHAYSEGLLDPAGSVDELVSWLLATGVDCILGLALGIIAARVMRATHLHWSWAAAALAVLITTQPLHDGWTLTLASAGVLAAVRGRRWHREDLEAGADLAELAARRTHPLDLLRSTVLAAAAWIPVRLGTEHWVHHAHRTHSHQLLIGHDESRRRVSIPFGGEDGGTHTLVVGATGSGKTVTQTWLAVRAIEAGMGAVVLDPKGDSGMRDELRRAALAAGRAFLEWTPDGERVYNPYARGGVSEIADKALAGERFTEPHYLRQAQRYLGHVVRALRDTGSQVSLRAIVEHLEPTRLELLARELPDLDASATFSYLDSLSSRQHSELAGVRDRLAILAESDVGRWLDPETDGAEQFELLGAVSSHAVVYFSLESDSRPLLSEMLGAAIVQDLQTTVAALQGSPRRTLVVIDEFSAIAAEQVVRLFGRARSAGFSLVLGTQELSDLRPSGRERLLEQVLGNLSVLIAHRQVVPDSAELIASVAGRRGTWKVSRHSEGKTTRVRGREPRLDPDRVMSLGRGWAAVLVLGDGGEARVARMLSPARSH